MTGLQISQFCFLFILNSCPLLFLSITPTEPEHKQEHIVLERSARLNLDPRAPYQGDLVMVSKNDLVNFLAISDHF